MTTGTNGNMDMDVDEGWRIQHLLRGAHDIDSAIPALTGASEAMLTAGRALKSIARDLSEIGANTARAISDTANLKRHVQLVNEREQAMRVELAAIRSDVVKLRGATAAAVVVEPKRAGKPSRRGRKKQRKKK